MNRIYKYLLRPDEQQGQALDFLLWQARRVYNMALEQRIKIYAEQKNTINSMDQWAYFRDLRNSDHDGIGKLTARTMQFVLRRLDKSFQSFFRRLKAKGELGKAGFPRFKSQSRFKSIEIPHGNGCKIRKTENGQVVLYVKNVGEIRVVYHRAIPSKAKIKMVVIKQVNGRWYANTMLELPDTVNRHQHPRRSIGIDVGLKSVVALSNKKTFEHPHWLKISLAKLGILQRKAARQKKGSKRQSATYKKIAKLHEHISNKRSDFYHKLSRQIANQYALIGIECLNLSFMNRNKHLSQSSYDAGLGGFRHMLTYKAEEAGGRVVAVKPAYTSQKCSRCGYKSKKSLSVRVHKCPDCGLKLDRDVNAARNILKIAKIQLSGRDSQALK